MFFVHPFARPPFCVRVVVEPARGQARGSGRDRYDNGDRYGRGRGGGGGGGGRYNDK